MSPLIQARPGDVPVPPWPMSTVAQQTYAGLGALTYPDPNNGWVLAALVDSWTTIAGWIDSAARPAAGTGEQPWASVLDPVRCPWWALRWCGQVYGLRLQPILDPFVRPTAVVEASWRAQIVDRVGWRRGNPATIIAVAKAFMVAPFRVLIRERYDPALGGGVDAPYHLQVRVRTSDVQPGRGAQLVAAVLAAIPIGLIADVDLTNDRDWDDVAAEFADWDAVNVSNTDWDDLLTP